MRETQISLPELALIAGTRALLGAGIGLLLADRLSEDQRKGIGWTLFLVGALSTIPLALEVFGRQRLTTVGQGSERKGSGFQSQPNEAQRQRGEFAPA
jgi:hypothetical protein